MKKLLSVILIVALIAATLSFTACNKEEPVRGFVKADGTKILDGFGNPIGLVGTNFGGWLVHESWLVPTDIGGEYGQIDMMLSLANRFDNGTGTEGKAKMEGLLKIYEDNWITEQDFVNVKNLGLNCVRIPFTYMNLYDAVKYDATSSTYVRTPFNELTLRADAFDRLDFALAMCEKYELYAILDMHGAVGSQSGNDHTGDIQFHDEGGQLWLDNEIGETCREKTKELWVAIANRYKDNVWVAAYDTLNEPGIKGSLGQFTGKNTWAYFDVLYDAIRAVDANHMISMESCWETNGLPAPEEYGWTNVLYQYHHYNWASSNVTNQKYYSDKTDGGYMVVIYYDGLNSETRNYPVLIGEFNVWGDSHSDKAANVGDKTQTDLQAWDGVMELYNGMGWNFTTWNYKHAATTSTWGLYNLNEGHSEQANYLTMTYDEIAAIWGAHNASNYHEYTDLTSIIKKHIVNFNTDGIALNSDKVYSILTYMDEE